MMWNLVSAVHDTVGIRHLLETNTDETGPLQRVFAQLVLDPDPDYSIIEDSLENIGQRASLIWWLGYSFKDPEAIEEIARPLDSPETSSHNRDLARINRQFALSARGQVAKSDSIGLAMDEFWGEALIDRVMRSMVPMFNPTREELLALRSQVLAWDTTTQFVSPSSVNEGHYGEIRALLLGSLAARLGDTPELQRHLIYLGAKPDARTPGESPFVFLKTLRAIDAWFRRQDEQVLVELENAQMYTNDVCAMCSRVHAQTINRFMRAEIMYSRGQYDEALRWYNSLWDGYLSWGADHLGTTYLRTAAILEERGQTQEAAQYYAKFVDLWKDSDPRYQEMVQQARDREQQIRTGQFAEGGQLIIPAIPSE